MLLPPPPPLLLPLLLLLLLLLLGIPPLLLMPTLAPLLLDSRFQLRYLRNCLLLQLHLYHSQVAIVGDLEQCRLFFQ